MHCIHSHHRVREIRLMYMYQLDVYVSITDKTNKNHILMLFESVPNLSLEIVNTRNTIMDCRTGIGYFLVVMR